MYHKVDLWARTMWWVDVEAFHRHMASLKARNVVYLDDYDPCDPDSVVITFDGVYRNVLTYAAPLLRRFGYPFELFISSDFIGLANDFDSAEPSTPFASVEDLQALVASGGRLQWHTRSHPKLDHRLDDPDWHTVGVELAIPDDLRALDTKGFKWFAYPYGAFSDDVYAAVRLRFEGAVSCHQGNGLDMHKLNRMTVTNSTSLSHPTLCVIVVSHNYGEFLGEAVESVLQQTLLPDKIILIDDASTDATEDICRKYASLRPELISYVRNDRRLGIVGTFRKAVDHVDSDYVCFLGADNRFSSNYIESCKGVLDASDERVAIAYSDFLLFGQNARSEYFKHDRERRGRVIDDAYFEVVFPEFGKGSLLQGGFIHGSAMYRRSAYLKVGGYQELVDGRPEDANLFKRMIKAGYDASKVGGAWLEYRQHSDEQANIVSRTRGELQFYRAYAKRLEAKVKVLEVSFGLLSPLVRLMSFVEKAMFEAFLRLARMWRRLF